MSTAANPYSPPSSDLGSGYAGTLAPADAIALRESLIKHEASIRAFGTLHLLSSSMFFVKAIAGLLLVVDPEERAAGIALLVMGPVGGLILLKLGMGMRRFDPGVKWLVGVMSGIGLLNPPVGTLINAYILYLVFGEKGKTVFSEEYRRVIEQTPEIKYQTPLFLKVLVGLLLVTIVAAIGVALMS